jgi:hypothetical protein
MKRKKANMNIKKVRSQLEQLTRKWWFFAAFLLLQLLPPFAGKGLDHLGIGKFLAVHLMHNFMRTPMVEILYPVFKILPILLVLGIILFGNKVSRVFSVYAGLAYLFFNVLQNFSITPQYGLGILTQNLVTMSLWFWEAYAKENNFKSVKATPAKILVVLLAFIAFWDPINPLTRGMDFNLIYLINNAGGLAFCMMTPVFLAVLIWFYPKVNIPLLRVNSLAGVIIGIFNVLVVFANPQLYWWFGVLHIPLFVLGVYGLKLGYSKKLKR